MNENPSQVKTLTVAGGVTAVGAKCYGFLLRGGSAEGALTFYSDSGGSTAVWGPITVAAGEERAHSFSKPLGRQGTDPLYARVTGTGSEADIEFD